MALPQIIEKPQRDWLFKSTKHCAKYPDRDLAILGFFLGTGLTTLQINRIHIVDVLHKNGSLRKDFVIRGTEPERKAFLSSSLLRELTENYLKYRVKNKIVLGDNPDQYRGLDPDEPLFMSNQGKGFSIVHKKTDIGADTYSCDALNRHIKKLLKDGGIESPSILSGRRTFGVNLKRQGYDVSHIHHMLGNKTLETTQKLVDTDTVSMGAIAAAAF